MTLPRPSPPPPAPRPRPERRIAAAFAVCTLASAGFAALYALGGQPWLEGVLLGLAFGGLAYGLAAWAAQLMPKQPVVEEHEPFASSPTERNRFEAEAAPDLQAIGRRRLLGRALTLAVGTLGLALLFPLRSLGPRPGRALYQTAWRPGSRLVTADGTPIRAGDLRPGQLLTVFPEGHTDAGDSAVLLIRVDPARLQLPDSHANGAPQGLLALSKLCTHAGCAVGLYDQDTGLLFCPCHQSKFALRQGARPVAGPATRPLPQLDITIDAAGELRALGDFAEPVGPGFWSQT